jgi:hypothetical protein
MVIRRQEEDASHADSLLSSRPVAGGVPGLGHVVLGRVSRGLLFFALAVGASLLGGLGSQVASHVAWMIAMVVSCPDAYVSAGGPPSSDA